jgi:hypothetical protein
LANYLGEGGFSNSTGPLNELPQVVGQRGIIEQYRENFCALQKYMCRNITPKLSVLYIIGICLWS